MQSISIDDIPCLKGLGIKWGIATVSRGTPEEQKADLLRICEISATDIRRLSSLPDSGYLPHQERGQYRINR